MTREHEHLGTFCAGKFTKRKQTKMETVLYGLKGNLFLLIYGLNTRVKFVFCQRQYKVV